MSGGTSFWLDPPRHSRVFFDVVKKTSRLRSIIDRFKTMLPVGQFRGE
jgi:hypothetical protein